MDFSERLKEFRSTLKISQEKLAKLLGTKQQYIGRYEKGDVEPSIEFFQKLAPLGCDLNWLITGAPSAADKLKAELENLNKRIHDLELKCQTYEKVFQMISVDPCTGKGKPKKELFRSAGTDRGK